MEAPSYPHFPSQLSLRAHHFFCESQSTLWRFISSLLNWEIMEQNGKFVQLTLNERHMIKKVGAVFGAEGETREGGIMKHGDGRSDSCLMSLGF